MTTTMCKKTNDEDPQQENIQAEQKQPAYICDLLLNGYTTLKATSREELADMIDNIPAETKYTAGAIGRSCEDGIYSLKISIVKK